jgi:hypothetical protein
LRFRKGSSSGTAAAGFLATLLSTVGLADVHVAGTPPGVDHAETSIAVSGQTIVIGFNDNRATGAQSAYAYSIDRGMTWTEGGLLPVPHAEDRTLGDPSVVTCGGAFHYATLYFDHQLGLAMAVYRGAVAEGVLTWGEPRIAATGSGGEPAESSFVDKEYLACDPATDTLYAAYTRFIGRQNEDGRRRLELVRSTTAGESWSAPTFLTREERGYPFGAIPAVGANGEVYVLWANRTSMARTLSCRLAVSTDAGMTFPRRRRVPRCRGRAAEGTQFQLPSLGVDRRTPGLVYVTYAGGDRGHGDIFVVRSTDAGATFPSRVRVTKGSRGSDQFFPWIAVDPGDGEVTVVWYDRRLPPRNETLDVFFARSTDGIHFGENLRLTSVSTLVQGSLRVGDYLNIVSDGTGAYASWADQRNGDWDIYFGFIEKGAP